MPSPDKPTRRSQQYAAAAAADPTNAASYYYNEGAVLTNTGKVDEAIAAFDKSIQLDPKRADAYYWKGVDMIGKAPPMKDGKMIAPAGTEEAFNKYLELQPDGKYAQASKDMLGIASARRSRPATASRKRNNSISRCPVLALISGEGGFLRDPSLGAKQARLTS